MPEPRFKVRPSQAAKLVGRDKSTILRAIRTGKLSATVGLDGGKRIDVAELERVYGALHTEARPEATGEARHTLPHHTEATEALVAELRKQLEAAERREADLRAETRQQLEAAARREERLLGLLDRAQLTDQRPDSAKRPISTPRPKRSRTEQPTPKPDPKPAAAPSLTDLAGAVWGAVTGRR